MVDSVGGAVRGLRTGPLCPTEAGFGVRAAVRGLCNAASEGVFFSERPPDFKTTPFRPTGDWEPGTDTKGTGYPSLVPSAPGYPVRARVTGR